MLLGVPICDRVGGYGFPALKHLTTGMGGGDLLIVNTYMVPIWSLQALFSVRYMY